MEAAGSSEGTSAESALREHAARLHAIIATQRDVAIADLDQGYFLSRPLPPDELEAWLLRHGAAQGAARAI